MKRSLTLTLILMLIVWAGCGFQIYLVHVSNGLRQQLDDKIRQLDEATQRTKEATEQLQQLLKRLPPQPAPDRRSKL
jgi:ABC-type lipoprotein release transport system permease subunit